MHTKRSRASSSPVRVRQEPPTVAEAVAAAQALTPDREQQVDITAGLMGLTPGGGQAFRSGGPSPDPAAPGSAATRLRRSGGWSALGRPGGCCRAQITVGGP